MFDRIADPVLHAAGVIGTTVGGAGVIVAQQVQSGWDSTTGIMAAMFAAGSGILAALWKAMRADQASDAEQRRLADEITRAELQRLRERETELVNRLLERGEEAP
jgi:hypothetical protein